ncbi:hypothetical protein Btru_059568 [Bulinus truncatus]|nr:hypothetical protein Btru_059568 [Bulinus truncatus]
MAENPLFSLKDEVPVISRPCLNDISSLNISHTDGNSLVTGNCLSIPHKTVNSQSNKLLTAPHVLPFTCRPVVVESNNNNRDGADRSIVVESNNNNRDGADRSIVVESNKNNRDGADIVVGSNNNNIDVTDEDGPIRFTAPNLNKHCDNHYLSVPGVSKTTGPGNTSNDSITVVSLAVPVLPRAYSAPDLSLAGENHLTSPGKPCQGDPQLNSTEGQCDPQPDTTEHKKKLMDMSKEELCQTYRLHVFNLLIFLVIVISISLSWYYKQLAKDILLAKQAVVFDPNARRFTLSDPSQNFKVTGQLGREIPSWILPLNCPLVDTKNPSLKTCVWKNKAVLNIHNFRTTQVNCYNVSSESLQPQYYPHDCIDLADDLWYGPSNQSDSVFPIMGSYHFQTSDYTIQNNGIFSSRPDMFWLSSGGTGIYVHLESPVELFWNISGSNQLCLVSGLTGSVEQRQKNSFVLNYTLCQSDMLIKTYSEMHKMFGKERTINISASSTFLSPLWSLKGYSQSKYASDGHVKNLTEEGDKLGFRIDKISMDVAWEQTVGDLHFDPSRFNTSYLIELSRDQGVHLVLTLSPYFKYTSPNFETGLINSSFVKDSGGIVPGFILYDGELTAVLDVFNQASLDWFSNRLKELKNSGIEHFRLTYGKQSWLPNNPHFHLTTGTPNTYRRIITETISQLSQTSTVEHSSNSEHVASFVPLIASINKVGNMTCIVDVIEQALTLSLLGYPLIQMDGYLLRNNTRMTSDLYKRWLQLAVTFPAYQIPNPPWMFDESVVNASKQYQTDRQNWFSGYLNQLAQEVRNGQPIIRPVWWKDSSNITAHNLQIKDEFLIGDEFLVAPILCDGVSKRNVYIPPGIWEVDDKIFIGPRLLSDHHIDQIEKISTARRSRTKRLDSYYTDSPDEFTQLIIGLPCNRFLFIATWSFKCYNYKLNKQKTLNPTVLNKQ